MPGPKSGVHGLICVDREGVASTKVVLQTRVVIRLWWLTQLLFLGAWVFRTTSSSRFSSRCSSACGRVLPLVGVSPGSLAGSVAARGWLRFVSPVSASFVPSISSAGCLTLVFSRFRRGYVFSPFLRHFRSCGVPARWRDLRHVVFSPGG